MAQINHQTCGLFKPSHNALQKAVAQMPMLLNLCQKKTNLS
jgi:hypothetical protein